MRFFAPTGGKLVAFLQSALPEKLSGKALRRLLEMNGCRVNGRVERFGSTCIKKGDLVEILGQGVAQCTSPKALFPFTTLYEDADTLFVDKPAGWVCSEENCRRTFGSGVQLVHRLDKDTTGVLALAKNEKTHRDILELFAKREVKKEYLALVDGIPRQEMGVRESWLMKKRALAGQTIWGSGPSSGLLAVTHWKRVASGEESSLLLCQPTTGRTHQIRVHLAEMGHPILVDRQYAARFRSSLVSPRPLLHASKLCLGSIEAEAPVPSDMQQGLHSVGIKLFS